MKHYAMNALLCTILFCGCSSASVSETVPGSSSAEDQTAPETEPQTVQEEKEMKMKIADTPVTVVWEDNASVQALQKLAENGPLVIDMSMYGGFEQVGPIGTVLPSDDVQTVTVPGDIVLYSSDQLVVFCGTNSWAYTRLGHITDKNEQELRQMLTNGNIAVTITVE